MARWLENLPAMKEIQETQFLSLGQEELLEEGMATHSSILAWEIPWTKGAWWGTVHRIEKSWTPLKWLKKEMATHSSVLA